MDSRTRTGVAGGIAILGVAVLALVWFFRPWLHVALFGIWKHVHLLLALPLALLAGAIVAAVRTPREGVSAAASVFVVAFVALAIVGPMVAQTTVANELAFEDRESIAETDAESPRILPQHVSDQYAENSLQFPRHRLGYADITMRNGTPHWSYALAPDGPVNRYATSQNGAVFVNMTRSDRDLETIEREVSPGFGMGAWNNYEWQLQKDEYWVDHQEAFMVPHEGELYIAAPYVDYDLRLAPIPHTVPTWGGVALVGPDGSVEHLSPDEARSNPVLEGQRLYPFDLAMYEVESTRYQHGIVNKLLFHEDELEVAALPGEGNDQPFHVMTTEGMQYLVAAEPYGDASGVYQVWHFDARDGTIRRYATDEGDAHLGPQRASNYVRQAAPTVDWDRLDPSEPLPTVVDDRLYWMVRVVPSDGSGISYTAFVDADTSDVVSFDTDSDVRRFLRGEDVDPTDGSNESVTTDGTVYISIVEDGEVVAEHESDGNVTIDVEQRPGNATAEPAGG